MALQKQALNMPFVQGLDTKSDPKQVQFGKMLALNNIQFKATGELQKRNGFGALNQEILTANSLTSFNNNLLAVGNILQAYNNDSSQWVSKGALQPVQVVSEPLIRNSDSQTTADACVAPNNLVCAAFTSGSLGYYSINDAATGNVIIAPQALPNSGVMPRVFLLGQYFIVTYTCTIAAARHLQYIAIPYTNPGSPNAAVDITSQVKTTAGQDIYDGVSINNNLYLAWNASDLGGAIRTVKITSTLITSANTVLAGEVASTTLAMAADATTSTPVVWIVWATATHVRTSARDQNLLSVLAPTNIVAQANVNHVTAYATDMVLTTAYQITQTYSFNSDRTDLLKQCTITQAGVPGTPATIIHGAGLVSKLFPINSTLYMLVAFGVQNMTYQPTYFCIDTSGNIVAKVAYSNALGYPSTQILTNVSVINDIASMAGLVVSELTPVNKEQGSTAINAIYSQTGVNLIALDFAQAQQSIEVPKVGLMLNGGFMWDYDGVKATEQGFHLWPDPFDLTQGGVGNLTNQQYFYVFTYEWTDAQGNINRSAPSVPQSITIAGGPKAVTAKVPTLRFTSKVGTNLVRIVGYRWSVAQQVYYQFTSITSPNLNDTSVDEITIVDDKSDLQILGNPILYTTGGIVENIGAPAIRALTLFKSRVMYISAENPNVIGYSKQVIQNVPVEMSDLFTIYASPTVGAQGSTGGLTAITAMDDKLLLARKGAWYYVTGNGPDNSGANNDFSDPIFITATVGCDNQNSIVLTPMGIMFQSDKGIWLMGRDLNTTYVGAPVEAYNSQTVTSAVSVPGTTEVRFTLGNGIILVYNYYYDQWSTSVGTRAVNSCVWDSVHTLLTQDGRVLKETPGVYLDNASPVLMSFTTAWAKLANLQGFQRAHFMYLIGNYITPHKLSIGIAYDYNNSQVQTVSILPDNYSPPYGDSSPYGDETPYGGPDDIEQWRIFFDRQKCQSIQLSIQEIFDPSFNTAAGAGLTFSGINLVLSAKKGYPTLPAARSTS